MSVLLIPVSSATRPVFVLQATKKKGFTLVELLVVVGIVLVLISLLIPALKGAREVARGVACTSNLSKISTAIGLYHGEANGWLPPRRVTGAYANQGLSWANALSSDPPILGRFTDNPRVRQNNPDGTQALFIDGTVPEKSVWRCPSDTRSTEGDGWSRQVSYAATPMLGDMPAGNELIRVSDIPKPDIELAFLDARWRVFEPGFSAGFGTTDLPFPGVTDRQFLPNTFTIGAPGNIYSWAKRHRKQTSANILFFDGHVATMGNLYQRQIDGELRVSIMGWRTPIVRLDD